LPGIFTSRSASQRGATLPEGEWATDGMGVTGAGNNVDSAQVNESFSVRLRNSDYRRAAIDLIFYVISQDGDPQGRGVCTVGLTTEWIICEDPDDVAAAALWRTSAQWDLPDTLDYWAATRWASRTAETLDTRQWDVAGMCAAIDPPSNGEGLAQLILGWDGQPFELPARDG
jgi:hypothetical protein